MAPETEVIRKDIIYEQPICEEREHLTLRQVLTARAAGVGFVPCLRPGSVLIQLLCFESWNKNNLPTAITISPLISLISIAGRSPK